MIYAINHKTHGLLRVFANGSDNGRNTEIKARLIADDGTGDMVWHTFDRSIAEKLVSKRGGYFQNTDLKTPVNYFNPKDLEVVEIWIAIMVKPSFNMNIVDETTLSPTKIGKFFV